MKVSAGSKMKGISYKTAWLWFKTEKMPIQVIQTPTGLILFEPETYKNTTEQKITFIYSRVSSSNKKEKLKEQDETIND